MAEFCIKNTVKFSSEFSLILNQFLSIIIFFYNYILIPSPPLFFEKFEYGKQKFNLLRPYQQYNVKGWIQNYLRNLISTSQIFDAINKYKIVSSLY